MISNGCLTIRSIKLTELHIPFKKPFRTARTVQNDAGIVVVEITGSNGEIGYGECTPKPHVTGETTGSVLHALSKLICPTLLGCKVIQREKIRQKMNSLVEFNSSAKSGVELALDDLHAKFNNVPVYSIYGGYPKKLPRCGSLDLAEAIDTENFNHALSDIRDYDYFKIKVGRKPCDDIETVRKIKKFLKSDVKLILDANQGWKLQDVLPFLDELSDLKIYAIEQPFYKEDINGMAILSRKGKFNIMADESLVTKREALELIRNSAASLFNLKLMKTGGICGAIDIARLASLYGINCMIGSTMESSLSVAAESHLACCISNLECLDFLEPSRHLIDDPFCWIDYKKNEVEISDEPGLGIRVNDRLKSEYVISEINLQ